MDQVASAISHSRVYARVIHGPKCSTSPSLIFAFAAWSAKEVLRRVKFCHAPTVKDQNAVAIEYGLESVRNGEYSAAAWMMSLIGPNRFAGVLTSAAKVRSHGPLNDGICGCVDVGRSLVEQKYSRSTQHGTS